MHAHCKYNDFTLLMQDILYIPARLPAVLKNKIYAYTSCLIDKKWNVAPLLYTYVGLRCSNKIFFVSWHNGISPGIAIQY